MSFLHHLERRCHARKDFNSRSFLLSLERPTGKNAEWEDPPQEGEPFDYDAVPSRFYFNIETVGGLEPDVVMQQGIKVLQQKLAAVIQELAGGDDRGGGGGGVPAADGPDAFGGRTAADASHAGPDYGMAQGYTTPYGNGGGGASAWGGGQTPYGATPYGRGDNPW